MAESDIDETEQEIQEAPEVTSSKKDTKGKNGKTSKQSGVRIAGYGIVKAVPSGDTLIVIGGVTAANPVAPRKELILAGINAPKFARGKTQEDEPFAWEAREFLRKKVIGQQVAFSVNFGGDDRDIATVHLGAENLSHSLVRQGLATVKALNTSSTRVPPEREALLQLQKVAQEEGLGIWKKGDQKAHIRQIDWAPTGSFLQSLRGKKVSGVVDRVLSGSVIRVEIADPSAPNKHKLVTLHLAGAQTPRIPVPQSAQQQQPQRGKQQRDEEVPPFADQAQQFTEARLLHRDVQLVIQGVDKTEVAFGTLLHPKGNISLKLLEAGLAKKNWTAYFTHEEDSYTAAEGVARAKKVNLWSSESSELAKKEFTAKVVFISSGDSLNLKVGDEPEKRYSLASIRCPRMGIPRRGEPDQPFAWEAREFVRSRLIGKKVRVVVEYQQTFGNEQRDLVSVYLDKQDIAEALLSNGLAEVLRHSLDGPRSSNYARLLEAETAAEKSGRGKFGPKVAGPKINDLTERFKFDDAGVPPAEEKVEEPAKGKGKSKNAVAESSSKGATGNLSRAKRFLSTFQREKQIPAVVEHVFSGTRFKVYIPKENVVLFFALSAIRAPAVKRPARGAAVAADDEDAPAASSTASPEETLGAAALEFMRSRILQQTVTLDIERMDKNENFLGQLYFNKQNLGTKLLAEGLGSISFSNDRDPPELKEAEEQAKQAKKGIWEHYVESEVKEEQAEEEEEAGGKSSGKEKESNVQNVVVTEVLDAASFYYRNAADPNFATINERLESFAAEESTAPEGYAPKKGELVAGLYSTDGKLYRARIEGSVRGGESYKVLFVDYGNHEVVAADDVRPLPEELQKLPGVAKAGVLAGLRPPSTKNENFDQAAVAFNELAFDRELVMTIEHRGRDGKAHVTLKTSEDEPSINVQLLQEGWCRLVDRSERALKSYVDSLRPEEALAKESRLHIWEYGDVSDEEEEGTETRRRRDDGRPPKRQ